MLASQLNTVVAAMANINAVTLHTADPGNTGANDSGETPQSLTWSTPTGGWMKATATFADVEGTFTHIGLWEDDVFIESRTLNVDLPSPQTLIVLVEFGAEVRAGSTGSGGVYPAEAGS